jgi:hypothetical protein
MQNGTVEFEGTAQQLKDNNFSQYASLIHMSVQENEMLVLSSECLIKSVRFCVVTLLAVV